MCIFLKTDNFPLLLAKFHYRCIIRKVIMQGNLISLCVHIETSSLLAEFLSKNRCISVRLVSVEDKKHLIWIIWIIHIIVSNDQNISLIFMLDGSHVRLRYPSCVYITAQRQYTAVQKMRSPLK